MSQIDELREILAGENTAALQSLKARIENVEARTVDVAEVLAPAIKARMKDDDSLISALKKPVSEGLKQAIRVEPDVYAEILYPAISPSIRRAISQAISSLMITINQLVASSTSASGIRTRLESWRTGIPFAELALRESLVYRVDHLYLIERDSGLLIGESHSDGVGLLDSDAVGAMFSAIASFVQDSFAADEESRLTDFKVGAHTVWAAHGTKLMLACVITGDPPQSLKSDLYDSLDAIRTNYSSSIAGFNGDLAQFDGVNSFLTPIMQMQVKDGDQGGSDSPVHKSRSLSKSWTARVVAGLILAALIYALYQSVDQRFRLATVQHYLKDTPGVIVTQSSIRGGKILIEGLKDRRAVLPSALLKAHGVDAEKLTLGMAPFISLDPEIEIQRISEQILTPDSIKVHAGKQSITVSGAASIEWIANYSELLERLQRDNRITLGAINLTEQSKNNLKAIISNSSTQDVVLLSSAIQFNNWFDLSDTQRSRILVLANVN